MSTIQVRAHHVTSSHAYECVRQNYGIAEVHPSVAVTIASWWQSSGSVGSVLAAFASGAEVDREGLLNDIHRTRLAEGYYRDGNGPSMSDDDMLALDMLATFVINYE